MQKLKFFKRLSKRSALLIAGAFTLSLFVLSPVIADTIQDQIRQLQQENESNRSNVAQLQEQATSYQDAINQLQAQINHVQGEIDTNKALQSKLQEQIVAAEEELAKQKKILGENLKQIYYDDQLSTLEVLASSSDLSEFVDKQEYRNVLSDKIKEILDKIIELKHQLKSQKETVEKLLKEQEQQQLKLTSTRAEQSKLLSYNQAQQAEYNQKTKDNQRKIDDLIAQQRRLNDSNAKYYFLRFPGTARSHDINIDNYPYKNHGFSMQLGPCSRSDSWPDEPDRWGYCTRQCVSYTAWAVERSGRAAPEFYGNAKDWVNKAYNRGIPVFTSDPKPGDVAISTAGTWGHSMYVEAVEGNRILVSQYNQQLDGRYSIQWRTFE